MLPLAALLVTACQAQSAPADATATVGAVTAPAATVAGQVAATSTALAATATPTLPPAASATATASATPSASPTADLFAELYIDTLRAREFDGANFTVLETLAVTEAFTRSLISYTGDGLTLYGFMNMPRGQGPFPVVIVNHGYIAPSQFSTLTYMTRYTDPLAQAGFLVIHPDYRGYGASQDGPNPLRIGYAVDVLNLIEAIKPLPQVDADAIGMLGHSMGGGISLRTLTVTDDVKAAVIYGSMSGDERANLAKLAEWTGSQALAELSLPEGVLERASPINALAHVGAAVSIHHGAADAVVPPAWSDDLYQRLLALGKPVEYYSYPGQPHTLVGDGHDLFIERVVAFFDQHLRAGAGQ